MKKISFNIHHDIESRKLAIVYINGEVMEGNTHADAIKKYFKNNDEYYYREDVENFIENMGEDNLPIAFAHLVDEENCYDEEPGIYIETDSLRNVNINDVINALKSKYPNYKFFNDNEVDNYGNYLLIAKKIKRLKKLSEFIDGLEYSRGDMISIYKNPTSREIDEAKSEAWNGSIRGIIDGNDIYCWRGDMLHDQLEGYLEDEDKTDLFSPTDGLRFSYDGSNSSWIFDIHSMMTYVEFFSEIKSQANILKNFGDLTGEINLYYANESPQYEFANYNTSELISCGIELNNASITLFNGINSIDSFLQKNLKTAKNIKRLR